MSRLFTQILEPKIGQAQSKLISGAHSLHNKLKEEAENSPVAKKLVKQAEALCAQAKRHGLELSIGTSYGYGYNGPANQHVSLSLQRSHPIHRMLSQHQQKINLAFMKLRERAILADETSNGKKADWMQEFIEELDNLTTTFKKQGIDPDIIIED